MSLHDDPFDEIVSGLSFEVPDDILDVSTLSIEDLLNILDDLNEELFATNQALRPTTQKGRDLHSLRNAVQVELATRRKR